MSPQMSPSLSGLICILTLAIQLTMMGKSQNFKLQTETTKLPPPQKKMCALENTAFQE